MEKDPNEVGYQSTQQGRLGRVLIVIAAVCVVISLVVQPRPPLWLIALVTSLVVGVTYFCFSDLTVRGESDRLVIEFGPIHLFRQTIPYLDITRVERDQASRLGGYGIHYTRKGWLWSAGGLDVVRIETRSKTFLVTTLEPDQLVNFLSARIASGHDGGH